jgi:hypothetical protein
MSILMVMVILILVPSAYADISIRGQDNTVHSTKSLDIGYDEIRVDGNGDGDVKDDVDYVVYNEVYLADTYRGVRFRPVYSLEVEGAVTQRIENFFCRFIEVRGEEYFVAETNSYWIKLAQPVRSRLYVQPRFSPSTSRPFLGGVRLGLDGNWNLYVVVNDSIVGLVEAGGYSARTEISHAVHEVSDVLDDYRVFVTDVGNNWMEVAVVDPANLTTLRDEQKDVFGYEYVRINTDEVPKGTGRIKFFGREYSLSLEEEKVRLEDLPYYTFTLNYERKRLSASLGYIPKAKKAEEEAKEEPKEWTGGLKIKDYENKVLTLNEVRLYPAEVRVDANQDGDVFDAEDYPLYNRIYIYEGTPRAKVKLVYSLQPPMLTETLKAPFASMVGMTVPIRGKDYLVTQAEENKITLGEGPVERSLPMLDAVTADTALSFADDIRMGVAREPGYLGLLHVFVGEDLQGFVELSSLDKDISYKVSKVTDALASHVVLITNASSTSVSIAIVEKDGLLRVLDEASNVLGYEEVMVNSPEFPDGRGSVKFLSRLYTVEKGNETRVEDAWDYVMQFNSLGEFRIVRRPLPKAENVTEAPEIPGEIEEAVEELSGLWNVTEAPEVEEVLEKLLVEEAKNIFQRINESREEYNEYIEAAGIPGPLRGLASGRINLHVGNETIGVVLEGGRLTEVREGGIENPTSEIWTTEEFLDNLTKSEDPVGEILEAQKTGQFKKEDHGLIPKLKGFITGVLLRIIAIFK